LGTWDSFFVNFWIVNPLLGAVFMFLFAAAVFPNGNLTLASLLSIIPGVLLAMVYAYFSAAMPRSGGDYIFTSRVIHPVLGFFENFNFMFWCIVGGSTYNIWLTSQFSIKLLNNIGLIDAYNFLMAPTAFFVYGIIYLILMAGIAILGLRAYKRVQWACSILGVFGMLVCIAILGMHWGSLPSVFNGFAQQYTGVADSVSYVIDQAKQQGHQFTGWNLTGLWGSLCIVWYAAQYSTWSNYLVGEIKHADSIKTHMIAMAGTAVVTGLVLAIASFLISGLAGWEFYSSFSYLTLNGLNKIPVTAYYQDLIYLVETNPALLLLFNLGFSAAIFILIPLNLMTYARCAFAWSFDRIAPSFVADVNPRFQTPVKTIVIFTVITAIAYWAYIYTGFYALVAASMLTIPITFLVTSIAAILFPYRMKEVYQASPAKKEIAGIPVISLAGFASAIFQLAVIVTWIVDPALRALAVSDLVTELVIGFLILCAVWFYIAKALRKSKEGIDISWAFKELPPG
jgi:amino acid transporter